MNRLFFSADTDVFGKPPCYEEAVLMEDPPPPYSEVLADPRGGTYTKPSSRSSREHQESETSKMAPVTVFPECGYSSLIRLPSARRWDSLGHLLSTMDLNHNSLPVEPQASAIATMPRGGRTHTDLGLRGLRGLDQHYGLPTAFPLLGRSTAVWGHKNRPLSEMNTHNAESFVVWRFCQRHFKFCILGAPSVQDDSALSRGSFADPSYSLFSLVLLLALHGIFAWCRAAAIMWMLLPWLPGAVCSPPTPRPSHHLFFLSHLRFSDIIKMTFQTLPLWHGVKYSSATWWNDSGWSVL